MFLGKGTRGWVPFYVMSKLYIYIKYIKREKRTHHHNDSYYGIMFRNTNGSKHENKKFNGSIV